MAVSDEQQTVRVYEYPGSLLRAFARPAVFGPTAAVIGVLVLLALPLGLWIDLRIVLAVIAVPVALWAAWQALTQPWRWELDADGLHEYRLGRDPRHYPWASIRDVQITAREVTIVTDRRTLRLSQDVPGTMALGQRLQAGQEVVANPRPPISPEEVAARLGIGVDETIKLEYHWIARHAGGVGALAAGLAFVSGLLRAGAAWDRVILQFVFTVLGVGAIMAVRRYFKRPIILSPTGVCREGGRSIAWNEVTDVLRHEGGSVRWSLATTRGRIPLPGPDADRIAEAVKQMLIDKHAGSDLPRMSDVPDNAISRAVPEVAEERGLSRAE